MKHRNVACIGCLMLLGLALDPALARNREAVVGQPRRAHADVPVKAGGPDCANATVIPYFEFGLGYSDTGNTCGATNKIDDYSNFGLGGPCNSLEYPGPDLIYRYNVLGLPNGVDVLLNPTGSADLGVFVLSNCMNGPSCVGFQDQIGAGADSLVALVNLSAGAYYIYVDSYYPTGPESCGDYQLVVLGELPVELMEFTVE